MNGLRVLAVRLAGLFGRERAEHDLDDELRFHFEQEVNHQISQGLSPADAQSAARRKFGGLDKTKEAYRDTRGLPLLENLLRDLRYGARMLWRNPAFTAVAVLSLGLGIGANSAVFTLTNALLLRGPQVRDIDRLTTIGLRVKGFDGTQTPSYPVFRELSERQTSFTALVASGGADIERASYEGRALPITPEFNPAWVSTNYFRTLGVEASLGRILAPNDDAAVVLEHGYWQTTFGGDPNVLGQTLALDGAPFTIVGVAAEGFTGERADLHRHFWIPITAQPRLSSRNFLESRTTTFFGTLGRLKDGVPATQAAAEITTLYRQILTAERASGQGTRIYRTTPADWSAEIQAGAAAFNPFLRRLTKPMLLLSGVVALVLLIACCNVANLLLARGAARQHEIGTRFSLGAGRGRLIGQLLAESLLLALLGGLAGFALASSGARFLLAMAQSVVRLSLDLPVDWRVLAFTTGVALATTLIFGLLPAMQSSRVASGRSFVTSFRQRTTRVLVVAQVALSTVLLVGAGLLLRSVYNLQGADLGLDRSHIATYHFQLEPGVDRSEYAALQSDIARRATSLPGARGVALSNFGLFSKGGLTSPARVPASPSNAAVDREMYLGYVSPGFFQAMGMEIALGRDFNDSDTAPQVQAGIVSESVARQYFGDASPIGQAIYFPGIDAERRYIPFSDTLQEARRYEIVGVVRDAFDRGPRLDPAYRIYLPIAPSERFADTLYVRSAGDPEAMTPAVLAMLGEFAGRIRFEETTTLEQQLSQNYPIEIMGSRMLSAFGTLAWLLAAVGLFGVMSYAVTRRTQEIGVRMALGSSRARVLSMVLRETLILVTVGMAIGIPVALATTGVLESLLFGLRPGDPFTIAAAIAALALTGLLAGWMPARRAANIDPMQALRHE